MNDSKMQELILHQLHSSPGREAILVPSMFEPPMMLSNIFRIGGILKSKGYTTAPNRRMNGWHFKLLDAGIAFCEAPKVPTPAPTTKLR
jgi:hypothetical protein